jgi:hypothetical protein
MSKIFNPADYNPIANPSRLKNNSPIPFAGVFVSLLLAIVLLWYFFPPKIRIVNPRLEPKGDQITAVAQAVNDTGKTVSVTVRFTVGYQRFGAKGNARFFPLSSHNSEFTLNPRSSTRISSDFSMPSATMPTQADVQITNIQ